VKYRQTIDNRKREIARQIITQYITDRKPLNCSHIAAETGCSNSLVSKLVSQMLEDPQLAAIAIKNKPGKPTGKTQLASKLTHDEIQARIQAERERKWLQEPRENTRYVQTRGKYRGKRR
jgi:hypothetical protein